MLGFLYDSCDSDSSNTHTCFVPTSSSCLPHAGYYGMRPWDSRHGRILFRAYRSARSITIIVWDPVTDERHELPKPPLLFSYRWTTASGTCDHLDCHGQPFTVVFMSSVGDMFFSYVYSSESGKPTSAALGGDDCVSYWKRSALVGNNLLYFVCEKYKRIVEYDLVTQKISVIDLPAPFHKNEMCPTFVELTTTEAGRLGFTRVEDFRLCLWSREVEHERWTLIKAIDLDKLQPINGTWTRTIKPYLVGSAEGVGVVFLFVNDELFTVDLRSDRVTKLNVALRRGVGMVVPYVNFCTPGTSCHLPVLSLSSYQSTSLLICA
ncbi:unnamed protein product [Urochloa decumbens]|uniref:F-box protein AT5G49610-like beta-propeller domain-containing protein n=1 Tax=Urochloa decumbens TaxID=240449 RepID=A0ABC9D9T7_9POAL